MAKPKFSIGDEVLIHGRWKGRVGFIRQSSDFGFPHKYAVREASGNRKYWDEGSLKRIKKLI